VGWDGVTGNVDCLGGPTLLPLPPQGRGGHGWGGGGMGPLSL
jgi:hypothetical protein